MIKDLFVEEQNKFIAKNMLQNIGTEHSKKKKVEEKETPVRFQIGDHIGKLKESRLKFLLNRAKPKTMQA